MIKICFICLGNICRSPMAEFMMKNTLSKMGLENEYRITSRGTSLEEYGHDLYPPAKEKLEEMHIPYEKHFANKVSMQDYLENDLFLCMDENNIQSMKRLFPKDSGKIVKFLERDVADPWYTGNFSRTYQDLEEGIQNWIDNLQTKRNK